MTEKDKKNKIKQETKYNNHNKIALSALLIHNLKKVLMILSNS